MGLFDKIFNQTVINLASAQPRLGVPGRDPAGGLLQRSYGCAGFGFLSRKVARRNPLTIGR